jgi:hypothetical protein
MAEQPLGIEIENDQHHAFAPVPVGVHSDPVKFNRTVLMATRPYSSAAA